MAKKRTTKRAGPQLVNQEAAAEALNVSRTAIRQWEQQLGFPQPTRHGRAKRYDVEAIRKWRAEQGRGSKVEEQARQLNLGLKAEKVRAEQLKNQKLEAQVKTALGELLPRRTVELAVATILTDLGDWCDQLPDLLAGQCCKKCKRKIHDRVQTELDNRRNQLADDLGRVSSE